MYDSATPAGRISMKFGVDDFYEHQIWLKSDKNIGQFT
jgi:hypothetical protein